MSLPFLSCNQPNIQPIPNWNESPSTMLVSFILLSYFYASTFVLLFSIFHCPGATSIFYTPLFLSFPESKHHFRKFDNVQPVSPTHQLLTQSITLVWNFVPIKTSPIFTLWLCPTSSSFSSYTSTQKLTSTTFAVLSPETSVTDALCMEELANSR